MKKNAPPVHGAGFSIASPSPGHIQDIGSGGLMAVWRCVCLSGKIIKL